MGEGGSYLDVHYVLYTNLTGKPLPLLTSGISGIIQNISCPTSSKTSTITFSVHTTPLQGTPSAYCYIFAGVTTLLNNLT